MSTAASRSFHNTIGLQGDELAQATYRAGSQEAVILSFFQHHRNRMFTPSEIHKTLFTPTTPLTSIRRAITNLTTAGYLRKTEIKTQGPYGLPEHCWYLPAPAVKANSNQLRLFGD
jgi:hypothetical protein